MNENYAEVQQEIVVNTAAPPENGVGTNVLQTQGVTYTL